MNDRFLRVLPYLLLAAGLLGFAARSAHAGDASPLSGSYQLLQRTDIGSHARLRLQIQLTNSGLNDFRVERLMFWDSSHRDPRAAQACSVLVRARSSAVTVREFVLDRAQYESWKRGAQPRLLLELEMPGGHKSVSVVRLNRVSDRKVN